MYACLYVQLRKYVINITNCMYVCMHAVCMCDVSVVLVSIFSALGPGLLSMHPYGFNGIPHVLEPDVLLAQEVVRESLVAVEDGQEGAAHVAHAQLLVVILYVCMYVCMNK